MFCELLHAKLVWMPSVCFIPIYYLQSWVYLYLVPLLLNRFDNLLAYVAALFMTSVFLLLSLRGWVDSAWESNFLDCSMSQNGILHVAEFLLIRGLLILFLISLDRAASGFMVMFSQVFAKRSFASV